MSVDDLFAVSGLLLSDDGLAAAPITYGRVATDPDHPGKLAVQYWFFYIYNDWNDRHEGDWEMIQLVFDTDDATAALDTEPVQVMDAQHEGGELSDWDGGPLQCRGTHPWSSSAKGALLLRSLTFCRTSLNAPAGRGVTQTA